MTTLAERQQPVGKEILIGATDEMKRCAPGGSVSNAVNAFSCVSPERRFSVDTGLGLKLLDNLKIRRRRRGRHRRRTHHAPARDHVGGLPRGTAVFTNATVRYRSARIRALGAEGRRREDR